jgi:hypothetical protein
MKTDQAGLSCLDWDLVPFLLSEARRPDFASPRNRQSLLHRAKVGETGHSA